MCHQQTKRSPLVCLEAFVFDFPQTGLSVGSSHCCSLVAAIAGKGGGRLVYSFCGLHLRADLQDTPAILCGIAMLQTS